MRKDRKETTARNLLVAIGIGQFNATQVIPYLMTQPATTDPKQPAIILLVLHLQRQMNRCGANLRESGYLDLPTANALTTIVGDRWETMPWFDSVEAVISAVANKVQIVPPGSETMAGYGAYEESGFGGLTGPKPTAWVHPMIKRRNRITRWQRSTVLEDLGFLGLPDVPGGVVTYGIAAYLLYRHLSKRKAG